jgi:hypothetical protein
MPSNSTNTENEFNPNLPHSPLPPHTLAVIERRWLDWEPHVRVELLSRGLFGNDLNAHISKWHNSHQSWVSSMLRRGIEMRRIKQHLLDDPREAKHALRARVMRLEKRMEAREK